MGSPQATLNALWFCCTLAVCFVAGFVFEPPAVLMPLDVLRALDRLEAPVEPGLRVAVGTNANVDVVVRAVAALEHAGVAPAAAARDHATLGSAQELAEAFEHFAAQGAAGERTVTDAALFARLAGAPALRTSVGGNAALMGARFAAEGAQVLLGGHVGPELAPLLPAGVTLPGGALAEADMAHVIMEYDREDRWGGVAPPRDNRFIVVADEVNAAMAPLEDFAAAVPGFAPHAVVLSGLHLLETLPEPRRGERLAALERAVAGGFGGSGGAVVHLELASMADGAFLRGALERLLPLVDSVGFNEQELAFILDAFGQPSAGVAQSVPDAEAAAAGVEFVLGLGGDRLTRAHFHSFGFHLLVRRAGKDRRPWRQWAAAAARGSVVATTHACGAGAAEELGKGDVSMAVPTTLRGVDGRDYEQRLEEPVKLWRRPLQPTRPQEQIQFYFAPVVQCRDPDTTVGLGDNISAAALVSQL